MMKKTFFLILVCFCSSCLDQPDCIFENENLVKLSFKTVTEEGIEPLGIPFEAISISDTDSLFFVNDSTDMVDLPINIYANSATIIFESKENTDTLQFTYRGTTEIISPDCGTQRFVNNLMLVYHTFDSVRVIDDFLSPASTTTYEIFY